MQIKVAFPPRKRQKSVLICILAPFYILEYTLIIVVFYP